MQPRAFRWSNSEQNQRSQREDKYGQREAQTCCVQYLLPKAHSVWKYGLVPGEFNLQVQQVTLEDASEAYKIDLSIQPQRGCVHLAQPVPG